MSRATAMIRLPDGTVRYALYEGTCDVVWRQTYAGCRAAWDAYQAGNVPPCECADVVSADYWTTYGSGTLVEMAYCPKCKRLRPLSYDFYEHMDRIGASMDGSERHDGWVSQGYDDIDWYRPAWVR